MESQASYTERAGQIKCQLEEIRSILYELKKNERALHQKETLKLFADTIQDIDIECQMGLKEKTDCETLELIHHFLFTPWGAPFVMDTSLLEASQNFKFQKVIDSDLTKILHNFVKHTSSSEKQIFETIDDIIDTLQTINAGEQAS